MNPGLIFPSLVIMVLLVVLLAGGSVFLGHEQEPSSEPAPDTAVEGLRLDDSTTGLELDKTQQLPTQRIYEETYDETGVHVKSRVEVQGVGSETVETNLDVNNGQVLSTSHIKATGTTITIKESQTIHATSSQTIEIDN